jgi:hypothetical protein
MNEWMDGERERESVCVCVWRTRKGGRARVSCSQRRLIPPFPAPPRPSNPHPIPPPFAPCPLPLPARRRTLSPRRPAAAERRAGSRRWLWRSSPAFTTPRTLASRCAQGLGSRGPGCRVTLQPSLLSFPSFACLSVSPQPPLLPLSPQPPLLPSSPPSLGHTSRRTRPAPSAPSPPPPR